MEDIILPSKVEYRPGSNPNEAQVVIEPLFPGYGMTIATAMRRVLLSSLTGGAIVAVKIKGASHEFSTLPYVKEDVVDIILNLKQLRFRIHTDEMVRLVLRAKGDQVVTGADIEPASDAQVANPEAHICTLTNKNAQVEMELMIMRGRGFVPTEAREKEKLELGTIMVDSLFTPVRQVAMHIENMRVGQQTNYNRVILDVETDGSITAQEAVEQSSQILIDHFQSIKSLSNGEAMSTTEVASTEAEEVMPAEEAVELLSEEATAEDGEAPAEEKKRGRPRRNEE